MKKMTWLVLSVVWIAGVQADSLVRTRTWAAGAGTEAATRELGVLGIQNEGNARAILESWDERVVVDKALEEDALGLLVRVQARDRLSAESVQRVLAHEQAKAEPSRSVWRFALALPREQQQEFEGLMERLVPVIFSDRPVAAELALKYEVRQGRPTVTVESESADLVSMLLAAEPMRMWDADRLRQTIKDHAVRLARRQLREQGLSFVTHDGVNPLTEAVVPVVDALNAPLAQGLEAALRSLGADVADRDRADLQAMTAKAREDVMLGDLTRHQTEGMLGRLSIGLGVEAFNGFVEEYNHGRKEPDRAQR